MRRRTQLSGARRLGIVGLAALALGVPGASAVPSVGTTQQAVPSVGSLTVSLAATSGVFAQPFVAQSQGFFRKAGLTVNLQYNTGAATLNNVASGQSDLGMSGTAGPLLMARQGRLTTIVYTHAAGASGGVLVGGKSVTSIQQINGKRIGTLGIGTSTYGFATIYKRKFNLNSDIVPYADNPTIAAALASDQIGAATGAYDNYASLIASGNAHILVDTRTRKQRVAAGLGPDYAEGAVYGLRDNIKDKERAVVAYVWALEQARHWIKDHTDQQVANELRKNPAFAELFSPEVALNSVKAARGYIAPTGGRIPAATWATGALDFYAQWGIPGFSASDPLFKYSERVNMGYLNRALRRDANYKLYPFCKKGQRSTPTRPCRRF